MSAQLNDYKGVLGYLAYAKQFYPGASMDRAYINVSGVLSLQQFRDLEWQSAYIGTPEEFERDRQNLVTNLTDHYKRNEGALRYAEDQYLREYPDDEIAGDLAKCVRNIRAALTPREREALLWPPDFYGSTEEFRRERERVLDPAASFVGQKGYVRYADEFYGGAMWKAFKNVAAVLTDSELADLGWKSYSASTDEFRADETRLSHSPKMYHGAMGYALYAEQFHEGFMQETFTRAKAVLTESAFQKLGWVRAFPGHVTVFRVERSQLMATDGAGRLIYRGPGYEKYADVYGRGNMSTVWYRAQAVLTDAELIELDWGSVFSGNTNEYRRIRQFLKNASGEIDFVKWSGQQSGLFDLVNSYMFELGYRLPFNEMMLKKVRKQIRGATTEAEKKRLGWLVKSRAPARYCQAAFAADDS